MLNFNNMIPVDDRVVNRVDLRIRNADDAAEQAYKLLMRNQIEWCNVHGEEIVRKANKLYSIVTNQAEKYPGLVRRCCDFKRLEQMLDDWAA